MRCELLMLLAAFSGCFVPGLDPEGKGCKSSCPAPYVCQAGLCVAEGGRLCAALPAPPHACFDFEGSSTLDAATELQRGGMVRVDTTSRRFGSNSLEASMPGNASLQVGRMSVTLPSDWRRITASFDVRPQLPSSFTGGISIGEVLCTHQPDFSGLWLFFEGTPPGWVVRADPVNLTDVVPAPSLTGWSRITLELRRPELRGTVRVNGVEAADIAVTDCGGGWSVVVGISGEAQASAWYDDVVIDVERL